MLPAVAQAAIGIEIRAADEKIAALLGPLDHRSTHVAVNCERAFLARLDGSCRTPIAGYAQLQGDGRIRFAGEILLPDGTIRHATTRAGSDSDAQTLGDDAGRELLERAGPDFFRALS
jgi:hydroxymethylbilane synthase